MVFTAVSPLSIVVVGLTSSESRCRYEVSILAIPMGLFGA